MHADILICGEAMFSPNTRSTAVTSTAIRLHAHDQHEKKSPEKEKEHRRESGTLEANNHQT
jgi:hypothetical protein